MAVRRCLAGWPTLGIVGAIVDTGDNTCQCSPGQRVTCGMAVPHWGKRSPMSQHIRVGVDVGDSRHRLASLGLEQAIVGRTCDRDGHN